MKTLAFIARKGGVGKTTLAAHIAVAASTSDRVALVDLDPQRSLSLWWSDRVLDTPTLMETTIGKLPRQLAEVQGESGWVVIDTPAFDSSTGAAVIAVADMVVIPVKPSPHDLRGVAVTVEAVKRAGKPFIFVLTQAVSSALLTKQAREVLAESGPVAKTVMHNRVAFASSMTDGRTVMEIEPNGKAAEDITSIYNDILTSISFDVKKLKRK